MFGKLKKLFKGDKPVTVQPGIWVFKPAEPGTSTGPVRHVCSFCRKEWPDDIGYLSHQCSGRNYKRPGDPEFPQ